MLTLLQGGYTKFCCFNVNGTAERVTITTEYKKAAPFRSSTKSEECGTSCFRGKVKNLFNSIVYQARIDKIFVKAMDIRSE